MGNIFEIVKNLVLDNPFYNNDLYLKAHKLEDFPVLEKKDVIWHLNNCNLKGDGYRTFYTSGSTGTPLKITWKNSDYIRSIAGLWRWRYKYGITTRDCCLTCHSSLLLNGDLSAEPIYIYDNYLSFSKLYFFNDKIGDYINYIRIFQPKWIYAQPSFVYQLAICLKEFAPDLLLQFRYVELVGEMVDPMVKEQIQSLFSSATVTVMYGMQEFNNVMIEENNLMVACADNVFIEILDDNNMPCKIEEEGNIVVTGLKNTLMPLVRYNTQDMGKKVIARGKEYFIITKGRANDWFEYKGVLYDGSIFFNVITKYNLLHLKQISKFQVIQEEDKLTFNVFGFDGLPCSKDIEFDIKSILNKDYNMFLSITVNIVYSFLNFINGNNKTKYFIKKGNNYE